MKKICLINPPTTRPGMEVFFPMALVALGSSLQTKKVPFEIIDFDLELRRDGTLREWSYFKKFALQKMLRSEAEIYGMSSICSNFPITLLLAEEIKARRPHARIVLGGPQPSAMPEQILAKFPAIDLIVVGEGENTLLDLMSCEWQTDAHSNIPGLVYRWKDQVVRTARRPLIEDLDTLPIPDFSLVNFAEYLTYNHKGAFIEAGRGCPFLCSFCSTALMWERKYRIKSPERILKEMHQLSQDYGFMNFSLTHDNFTTSHSYVNTFCDYFKRHNDQNFGWFASARPDTLTLERLAALHEAGCQGLFFGVDSGSPRIQQVMLKHLNLDHFREILRESVKKGIGSTSSFIVGFPEETEDDVDQTIRLALWCKLTGSTEVQLHRLAPHEGTAVAKQNLKQLVLDPRMADTSLYPIDCPEVDQLIATDSELFSSFYSLPTNHLGTINITAFTVLYDELINHMAPTLRRLLDATEWSPTDLYKRWMAWKVEAYPKFLIDSYFVFNKFPHFLQTALYPKKNGSRRGGSLGLRKKPLIFLGSTLPIASAQTILDADFHPPIQRGDLLQAVEDGYRVIGIIDGLFHQSLTVSIQEIRDAISDGAVIYGAASMGALRAAETYPLGMKGVGQIYNWYRSEKIVADDEVAVCLNPDTHEPLSEPLVNIRATLEAAFKKGLISAQNFDRVLKIAQSIPFTERSYPILGGLLQDCLPEKEHAALLNFFLECRINLKASDAVQLLLEIRENHACSDSHEALSHSMASG